MVLRLTYTFIVSYVDELLLLHLVKLVLIIIIPYFEVCGYVLFW